MKNIGTLSAAVAHTGTKTESIECLSRPFGTFLPKSDQRTVQTINAKRLSATKDGKNVVGKDMATVFWNSHGIILVDYLEIRNIINGEYYVNNWGDKIIKKQPQRRRKWLSISLTHLSTSLRLDTIPKINELRFELVPHSLCSSHMDRNDYYLFPNRNKCLEPLGDYIEYLIKYSFFWENLCFLC